MAATTAQMIETNVCNDAVDPGVERAFKTETGQVAENFQERLLIDVLGVFGAAEDVESEPQDLAVVAVDKDFESRTVSGLRALDEDTVIGDRVSEFAGRGNAGYRRRSCTKFW